MKFVILTILIATFASTLTPLAPAQGGPNCPNTIATNIPARVQSGGPYTHCGLGIQIFGFPITLGGSKCYRYQFIYPAHQECLGNTNPGTACINENSLPVGLDLCECSLLGVIGTGISVPKCTCKSGGSAGTVDDAQTVTCNVQP
jgi:hypothetical protein